MHSFPGGHGKADKFVAFLGGDEFSPKYVRVFHFLLCCGELRLGLLAVNPLLSPDPGRCE
jgi:hypothetical protein